MIRRQNAANLYVDEFRAWLLDRKAGDVVGGARTADDCPLANFLRREQRDSDVDITAYVTKTPNGSYYTPSWARRFLRYIDSSEMGNVCAYQALGILDDLEKETLDD